MRRVLCGVVCRLRPEGGLRAETGRTTLTLSHTLVLNAEFVPVDARVVCRFTLITIGINKS